MSETRRSFNPLRRDSRFYCKGPCVVCTALWALWAVQLVVLALVAIAGIYYAL